jgi:ATP-dependent DNA helicase RecQ
VVLLNYFGEATRPCGNCDVCLEPPQTWDATVAAQKLFSAVLRTGSRFGAGYLIDILRGKTTERVKQFGHDRLPTFGVGAELDDLAWRSVVRQLVALGLLHADARRYGALGLTDAARPVLRGESRLQLRHAGPKRVRGARRGEQRAAALIPQGLDAELVEALRSLRRELAGAQRVPPYIIFHDATLHELARLRPRTEPELYLVSGIGANRVQRYGQKLLEVLRRYPD